MGHPLGGAAAPQMGGRGRGDKAIDGGGGAGVGEGLARRMRRGVADGSARVRPVSQCEDACGVWALSCLRLYVIMPLCLTDGLLDY